jgi:hypothetical protein
VSIFGPAVATPPDTAAASWIARRLGESGTVGGLVPDGFDQYVLVHPAILADGGTDAAQQISAIASIARQHTTTPGLSWFAIWEGWGWTSSTSLFWSNGHGPNARFTRSSRRHRSRVADRQRHRRIRRGLEHVPQFDLPNRRYYLVHGPLPAAASIRDPGATRLQVPDLWWPDDRQWFVATDTDLDWTYAGGSQAFINEIAASFVDHTEVVHRDTRNDRFA